MTSLVIFDHLFSYLGRGQLTGMLNLSGIFSLNVSEMAGAGFCHRNANGVELVRNFMMEFVRNILYMTENVRNLFIFKKWAWMAGKCPKYGWKMSEIWLFCMPIEF